MAAWTVAERAPAVGARARLGLLDRWWERRGAPTGPRPWFAVPEVDPGVTEIVVAADPADAAPRRPGVLDPALYPAAGAADVVGDLLPVTTGVARTVLAGPPADPRVPQAAVFIGLAPEDWRLLADRAAGWLCRRAGVERAEVEWAAGPALVLRRADLAPWSAARPALGDAPPELRAAVVARVAHVLSVLVDREGRDLVAEAALLWSCAYAEASLPTDGDAHGHT